MKSAILLFSGGQDSTTCLGWAINNFDKVLTVSYFYGQNHKNELDFSSKIANKLNIEQRVIDISFYSGLINSALTSHGDLNQKHRDHKNLPSSFVPNRNHLFILIAHSIAQTLGYKNIIIGASQSDYSGYPDCRNIFIRSLEGVLNLGSEVNIKILTPLMFLNKAQIFSLAESNGVLDIVVNDTMTCYSGDTTKYEWGMGCGHCPSCKLRKSGYIDFKKS